MIVERLARLGYASIGVVYMIVGGFAVAAGLGRGSTASHGEAFAFILRQPLGQFILAIIALGLAGYAVWRFASAVTDTEHRGDDPKGMSIRLGSFGRGLIHAAFAFEVVRMILHGGHSGGGEDQKARHWTAQFMDAPFGRWLVAAVGLGVVIYGAYQLYAAWDAKLSKRLSLGEIDDRVRRKVVAISRFGIGARGLVFFVVGGSIVMAAVRHNPQAVRGTTGALKIFPEPVLVLVGLGLAAYGVYALVNAKYRRIAA